MSRDDVIDMEYTDGGAKAFDTVRKFLNKAMRGEAEGPITIVLSQTTGRNKEQEDEVETFEDIGFDADLGEVAQAIVEAAEQDIEGLKTKRMKYSVRIEGFGARCTFTLKYDSGEEEDIDDIEDMPNRKGLMGMLMRHQNGAFELAIKQSAKMIDRLVDRLDKKDQQLDQWHQNSVKNIMAFEELVNGRHVRDMEIEKQKNKDRRLDQLAGTVLQGFPLLVNKMVGGGAQAAQTAPGGRTQLEGMVEGLVRSLNGEQLQKIAHSGMFTPVQIMGLMEIANFIMEREEAERASQNGAAQHGQGQSPPAPDAKPPAQ